MPRTSNQTRTSEQTNTAEVAKRTKVTKPLIDYSALTPEESAPVTTTRGSVLDGTPFVGWVQESHRTGEARQITVPNNAAKQTESLLRLAADKLKVGVAIDKEAKGATQTIVRFQGKARRAYNGKKASA